MAKKRERHQNPQPFFTEENEDSVSWKKRSKSREGRKQHHMEEKLLSSSTSSKILKEALVQQREVEDEEVHAHNPNSLLNIVAQEPLQDHDDIDNFHGLFDEAQCSYDHNYPEIDEAEEKLLEAFLSKEAVPQRTLADIIVAKIKEKDANISSEVRPLPKLDTSVIELYKGLGKILSKYTTGRIPLASFLANKHISSMINWEDALYLTEPENWSPNAMYQATRILASNLGVQRAERFYKLVLLPQVREDIRKNKRLHFALLSISKKVSLQTCGILQRNTISSM